MNIVLIEDHESLRIVTANILREAGYHVSDVECVADIDVTLLSEKVDIFILDINLPGESGISFAARLRRANPLAGIIMITASNLPTHMTESYTSGADMYLIKPIHAEALLAAVTALSRRVNYNKKISNLTVDSQFHKLIGSNREVMLQLAEVRVLTALSIANMNMLETGEVAELFGMDDIYFNKATLDVRISRLRTKLKQAGGDSVEIRAIRSKGYQLTQQLQII